MWTLGRLKKDERGQVGIGTLIVFIAMVLVAAIAAAVLINTAGLLQQRAQATGKEATEQTSTGVNVVAVVGNVTTDTSGNYVVDWINLTVKLRPGSLNIDLGNTTIEYIDKTVHKILTCSISHSGRTSVYDPANVTWSSEFVVTVVYDDDTSLTTNGNRNPVLNSRDDVAKIHIKVGELRSDAGLPESQMATIKIVPPTGATTTWQAVIPQSLAGKTVVSLD